MVNLLAALLLALSLLFIYLSQRHQLGLPAGRLLYEDI